MSTWDGFIYFISITSDLFEKRISGMVILNLRFSAEMGWICFFVIFTYYIYIIYTIYCSTTTQNSTGFTGFSRLRFPTLKKYGCLGKGQFLLTHSKCVQKSVQGVSKVRPNQINGARTAGSVRLEPPRRYPVIFGHKKTVSKNSIYNDPSGRPCNNQKWWHSKSNNQPIGRNWHFYKTSLQEFENGCRLYQKITHVLMMFFCQISLTLPCGWTKAYINLYTHKKYILNVCSPSNCRRLSQDEWTHCSKFQSSPEKGPF